MIAVPSLAHADAANPTSTLAIGDWWKYNVQTPLAGLVLTGSQTQTIEYQANTTATEWTAIIAQEIEMTMIRRLFERCNNGCRDYIAGLLTVVEAAKR